MVFRLATRSVTQVCLQTQAFRFSVLIHKPYLAKIAVKTELLQRHATDEDDKLHIPEGKTTELLTEEQGGGAGVDAGFAVFTVKPSPPPLLRWGLPYVAAYRTSTPCMIPPFGTRLTATKVYLYLICHIPKWSYFWSRS